MSSCLHTRHFSSRVYAYLSRVFRYRLGIAEIGITDIFTFEIVDFCYQNRLTNIEIYKTTWPIESVYGNDIDLFIQRSDGQYNRFALQAKVMSFNGAYKDIKYAAINQWDKLLNHETTFGSKSFYLFYNGQPLIRPITSVPTRADCLGTPPIAEYGLGIVETPIVKSIKEGLPGDYQKVYMRHFFPDNMDSVRKLFCCEGGGFGNDRRGYELKEIYLEYPYERIRLNDQEQEDKQSDPEQIESNTSKFPSDIAATRILIKKSSELNK